MKIIPLEQRSESWFSYRRSKIMATDCAVIISINKWKTPYQLWLEKLGYEKHIEPTPSMIRGVTLEPFARELHENCTGIKVFPVVVESEEYPWAAASLDGLSEDGKTLVEIKVSGDDVHEQAKVGIIQPMYNAQIQHQMFVTELDKAIYFSFNGIEGIPITIYRDDAFIKNMIVKELEFWDRVQTFEAPETTNKDFMEINSETFNNLAKEYLKVKNYKEILSMQEGELRDQLIAYCQAGNVRNSHIKIQKIVRKGHIEYKNIPNLIGLDLEQFRKPTIESWRILEVG